MLMMLAWPACIGDPEQRLMLMMLAWSRVQLLMLAADADCAGWLACWYKPHCCRADG